LKKGAKLQLRGHLQLAEFEKRVVPKRGIEDLVVENDLEDKLREIVTYEKAKKLLFAKWGFSKSYTQQEGTVVLLHGPSGCGKSLAAEALGYEIGRPLKLVGTKCLFFFLIFVGDLWRNTLSFCRRNI